jgi:hypothetical protein
MQRINDKQRRKDREEYEATHPEAKVEHEQHQYRKGHMEYYKEKMAKHKERKLKEAKRKARHRKHHQHDDEDADEEVSLLQQDNNPDGEEIKQKDKERNTKPYFSGWWAKDRPHELRLDPGNMKVYKFDTYKLRFPNKHDWRVEMNWKKLPKAPHRVYRNNNQVDPNVASFLDEHHQPLVYVSDMKGYWHLGTKTPTQEDLFKRHYPQEFKHMAEGQLSSRSKPQEPKEEERFKIYSNYTNKLTDLVAMFKNGDAVERETAHDKMIELRGRARRDLGLRELRHGRADIIIRGPTGNMCNFMVEVDKVSVGALRKQIEKRLDVPADAQELYIGDQLLNDDTELLNKRLVAGHPHYVNMIQDGRKMYEHSKKRREEQLKNQPVNKSDVTPVLVEKTEDHVDAAKDTVDFLKKHGQNESYTIPRPIDPELKAWMVSQHKKMAARSHLQDKVDEPTPPKRRVLYVRDPSTGHIMIEKEEVATALHPLPAYTKKYNKDGTLDVWHVIDRGISLEALLEEEDAEHKKEEEQTKKAAVL